MFLVTRLYTVAVSWQTQGRANGLAKDMPKLRQVLRNRGKPLPRWHQGLETQRPRLTVGFQSDPTKQHAQTIHINTY